MIRLTRVFATAQKVVFALLLGVAVSSCGAPIKTAIDREKGDPKDDGNSKVTPQVGSDSDLFAVAFREIGWSHEALRRSRTRPTERQIGCITNSVNGTILRSTYSCTRISDDSDLTKTPVRYITNGTVTYTDQQSPSQFMITSDLSIDFFQISPAISLGRAIYHRDFWFQHLSSSDSTTYPGSGDSTYAAKGGENFTGKFVGTYTGNSLNEDLILKAGSRQSLRYGSGSSSLREAVQIVAMTDVKFITNGNCLRPVGTFNWTLGETNPTGGQLMATADGFKRGGDTAVTPWGTRCLER